MDILAILRGTIGGLPEGAYSAGLRSVISHIEIAERHLLRGQADKDESAFTDAIYRTNQAFEGIVKEAYRVLADKDPSKIAPFKIEKYLQDHVILKPRVLARFSDYRTNWRNPSVHDYNLTFDENEAFLAIVSVSAFAKMLSDQISEKLASSAVEETLASRGAVPLEYIDGTSPLERISNSLKSFGDQYSNFKDINLSRQSELMGAVSAYMRAALTEADIAVEPLIAGTAAKPDFIVSLNSERIVVEVKSTIPGFQNLEAGLVQMEHYLSISNLSSGVLFIFTPGATDYDVELHIYADHTTIAVVLPAH